MTNLEKCQKSLELSYFHARKFNKTKKSEERDNALKFFGLAHSYCPLTNNALTLLYRYINGIPENPSLN